MAFWNHKDLPERSCYVVAACKHSLQSNFFTFAAHTVLLVLQACKPDAKDAIDLQQQRASLTSCQAGSLVSTCPAARDGAAAHWQTSLIDVERNDSVAHKVSSDPSSTVQAGVSKQILLPAGVSLGALSQARQKKHTADSGQAYIASINESISTSEASQTTHFQESMLSQSTALLPNDPVAIAIEDANRVVSDRARLRSLADQQREALKLHMQAKDTYFAAAQIAYDKGMCLGSHDAKATYCFVLTSLYSFMNRRITQLPSVVACQNQGSMVI